MTRNTCRHGVAIYRPVTSEGRAVPDNVRRRTVATAWVLT
jgi:hypothetical protein